MANEWRAVLDALKAYEETYETVTTEDVEVLLNKSEHNIRLWVAAGYPMPSAKEATLRPDDRVYIGVAPDTGSGREGFIACPPGTKVYLP